MGNESPEERLAADLAAGDDDECTWCQRAPGLILIGAAVVLGYIGVDILTGGWLTRMLTGAAAAVPPPVPSSVTVTAGEVVTDGADES